MFVPIQKALLPGALLAAFLVASPAAGKDVYKAFLDPAIPHHAAILDTLSRIEKNPADAQLHNDLGCLVAWDGFWRDALRSFDKAARLAPKDSRPWFNAGPRRGAPRGVGQRSLPLPQGGRRSTPATGPPGGCSDSRRRVSATTSAAIGRLWEIPPRRHFPLRPEGQPVRGGDPPEGASPSGDLRAATRRRRAPGLEPAGGSVARRPRSSSRTRRPARPRRRSTNPRGPAPS